MSNTSTEINGFFRPCFYTPSNGEKATAENIRKSYHAQDPKPGTLKTTSPAIYTGLGITVLGLIGSMFGFTKENSIAKWLGGILAVIGLGLAGVGKFGYGVDFKSEKTTPVIKPAEEGTPTDPPVADPERRISLEEEQRLLQIMEDPEKSFTEREKAHFILAGQENQDKTSQYRKERNENARVKQGDIKRLSSEFAGGEKSALASLLSIAMDERNHSAIRLKAVNELAGFAESKDASVSTIETVSTGLLQLCTTMTEKDENIIDTEFGKHLSIYTLYFDQGSGLNLSSVLSKIKNRPNKNEFQRTVGEYTDFLTDERMDIRLIFSKAFEAFRSPDAIEPLFECMINTKKELTQDHPQNSYLKPLIDQLESAIFYIAISNRINNTVLQTLDKYIANDDSDIKVFANNVKSSLSPN